MNMSMNQNLELIWVAEKDRTRPQPRLRLTALEENDPGAGSPASSREAHLRACGRPRCGCVNVLIDFQPPIPSGDLWLDLDEQSLVLSREQKNEPECLRIDGILRAELTDADRQGLREWFFAEKMEIIETTPEDEIDFDDLPDADGGWMVGFVEVFPCGLSLNFTLDNETWTTDEAYCVQLRCKCTETALSFLKVADAEGKPSPHIRKPPAIRYNYRSRATRTLAPGPAGSPSCDRLLATLKEAHPNLDLRLQLHHEMLQFLYGRMDLERTGSQLKSLIASAVKVGRNEPCPCGSGKKYKRCCLNKDVV